MTITNDFFDRLEGTWENTLFGEPQDNFGWNFISQPSVDQASFDDFHMASNRMRETITFERLPGTARNVGVSGEAGHWQAMSYEVNITDVDTEDGIHHEVGHFLLRVEPDGQTPHELHGDIIRQAAIPRANAIMTTGVLRPGRLVDAIEIYDARPQTDNPALQAAIDAEFDLRNGDVTGRGGPNLDQPLTWLQTILPGTGEEQDWVFAFRNDRDPSQMAHGQRVINPVGIGNLLSDFWIAKRKVDDPESGEEVEIDILQYAQVVNLIFNRIEWPHMAVNTLVKQ